MIEAEHAHEPPGDVAQRAAIRFADHRRQHRLARLGGPGDAAHIQIDVVQKTKVRAAVAERQMLRQMPVAAQRVNAEFGHTRDFLRVGALAQREKHVCAGVVGPLSVFFFLDRAPARQTPDRVAKPGRAARGGSGIEWFDGNLLRRARNVREHVDDSVGFIIEPAAAIGHQRIFMLIALDGNPIERLLEQIDGRGGIEGEHLFAHGAGEPRVDLVERHHNVDGFGCEPRRDAREARQVEAEKSAGEVEIIAQEIESAKQAFVVGNESLVVLEAYLLQHALRAADHHGIAERIEDPEVNAATMREYLFVERDRIGFLAQQMKPQRFHSGR